MSIEKLTRYSLGVLLAIVAINAFGGGIYGLSGAKAVPIAWLEGTPFQSYFIPSLILLTAVGGTSLSACITTFRSSPKAINLCYISGLVLLVWILVQVYMIGYVSWLQPAMFIAALLILLLTRLLPQSTVNRK